MHSETAPKGRRGALLEALETALAQGADTGTEMTLLLLDVDDLAAVTARIGPVRADALLDELERRLAACAGPDDAVARAGGDELAVVLPAGRTAAESVFARLQARLRSEPAVNAPVAVSAGIATARPGESTASLLARASTALREAKRAGKGTARAAV